jgi:antitoxin component HigA of HigAB toxin-antitoxin module
MSHCRTFVNRTQAARAGCCTRDGDFPGARGKENIATKSAETSLRILIGNIVARYIFCGKPSFSKRCCAMRNMSKEVRNHDLRGRARRTAGSSSSRQTPQSTRNQKELAELTALLESLAANEIRKTPAMERFIETLTVLILQYEDEIEADPKRSPAGVLKYLMEERGVRQIDHVPILGSKSYVSQILSGHRPLSKEAAHKLAAFFQVSVYSFI